jgi:hypothetical protein
MADTGLKSQDVLSAGLQVGHQLIVGFQCAEAFIEWDGIDQGP